MELEAGNSLSNSKRTVTKTRKPFNSAALHRRSKSALEDKFVKDKLDSSAKTSRLSNLAPAKEKPEMETAKKKKATAALPEISVQRSLKHEIVQLEKHLKDQMVVRGVLEKALGHDPLKFEMPNDTVMLKPGTCPKLQPTEELIKEIAVLEYEVKHLEQHLLTLYRRVFEPQMSSRRSVSSQTAKTVSSSCPQFRRKQTDAKASQCTEVNRCQSALSYRADCSSRISPSEESLERAIRACHSQPLSFLEEAQSGATGVISLADYLGTSIADHIPETPNNLSEEMVRCMVGIYCKISDPPLVLQHCSSSSPTSSFSSMSAFSPQYVGDIWSPKARQERALDTRLINPFCVQGLKEFSGPYNAMVEVPSICRDRQKLKGVEALLQTYRLIVLRLETVDVRKLMNDEKLAFWINIHNALLMHAFLKFGIPQNSLKKASLLIKAECKIGSWIVNAAAIQGLILGCHTYCSGLWLRNLFSPKSKGKEASEWQAFAIQKPEPLLRFALCTGSHSDPAVRLYTPKRLHQQLEAAKEEFIRATVGIWKEQKVLLPKLVESYAKDVRLTPQSLLGTVQRNLPEALRIAMLKCNRGRSSKSIDWVPYNSSFRYLISRELAFPHIT